MDTKGTPDDFIGHAGSDNFIIITTEKAAPELKEAIKSRFSEEVLTHYNFMDREQGYITVPDENGED